MIITSAAFRLALAHGHEWAVQACHLLDKESLFKESGVNPAVLEEAEKAMELRASSMAGLAPFIPGMAPANDHVTGTGRLEWSVDLRPDGSQIVKLAVHRPAEVVGCFGSLCVLQAKIVCNADGHAIEASYEASALAEKRHWMALFGAAQALGVGDYPGTEKFFDAALKGATGVGSFKEALEEGLVRDIRFWTPAA